MATAITLDAKGASTRPASSPRANARAAAVVVAESAGGPMRYIEQVRCTQVGAKSDDGWNSQALMESVIDPQRMFEPVGDSTLCSGCCP